jgi:hypothetical protein
MKERKKQIKKERKKDGQSLIVHKIIASGYDCFKL